MCRVRGSTLWKVRDYVVIVAIRRMTERESCARARRVRRGRAHAPRARSCRRICAGTVGSPLSHPPHPPQWRPSISRPARLLTTTAIATAQPRSLNPKPHTPNSKPQTPNPTKTQNHKPSRCARRQRTYKDGGGCRGRRHSRRPSRSGLDAGDASVRGHGLRVGRWRHAGVDPDVCRREVVRAGRGEE